MNLEGYDRVTSVLAPFSGLAQIPHDILENAKNRGIAVDLACKAVIQGMGWNVPVEWEPYVESFCKWHENGSKQAIFSEPGRLFDENYKITGEPDGMFVFEGKNILFDIKATYKESPTWPYQLSAYQYLSGEIITDRIVIHLNKKGDMPTIFYYDYIIGDFLNLLTIYRKWFKNNKLDIADIL